MLRLSKREYCRVAQHDLQQRAADDGHPEQHGDQHCRTFEDVES